MCPSPALSGVRVLELSEATGHLSAATGYAVPYAAKLLADLGAGVTLVEGDGGHPLRRGHPGMRNVPHVNGAVFEHLARQKSTVTVAGHDEAQLSALASNADIILDPTYARDGVTTPPGAAVVRVSPWGADGPYTDRPATPLILQAAAGWITSRKEMDLWPVQVGGHLPEWAAGASIATAALTAHRQARVSNTPVTVDFSLFEAAHSMLCYDKLRYDARGELGVERDRILIAPFGIRACKDGWVGINTLTQQQWADACRMTGLDAYIDQQQSMNRGVGDLETFGATLEGYLAGVTVAEVVERGQARRIPVIPVVAGSALCAQPQWVERPFFVEGSHGGMSYRSAGPPWRVTRASQRSGSDRTRQPETQAPQADAVTGPAGKPLRGLRVIDLSHFWSGPYLSMFLGAYGADVVKVESVRRPDAWRANHTAPSLGERWHDRGLLWQATNLDKRDITLELGSAEGLGLLKRLCASADVFLENYSFGVLERYGLTYEALRESNPRIIMVRLPGFGLEGPWRDYVGFGDAFEQVTGFATVTGYPDGRPQTPGGYMDPMVGMHAGAALLAAIEERDRTGEGQLIEVPQIEVAASMTAAHVIADDLGVPPRRTGNRTPGYAPQGVYRCGDATAEYVAISIRDDDEWARFAELVGHPQALDATELGSLAGRHASHDELDRHIQAWTATLPVSKAVDTLLAAGIPAARLLRPARYDDDPHLVARRYYQRLTHPLSGPRAYPTFPMRFSFDAGREQHVCPAPLLGQHNAEILGGELGLTAGDLARLEDAGVIGCMPLPASGLA